MSKYSSSLSKTTPEAHLLVPIGQGLRQEIQRFKDQSTERRVSGEVTCQNSPSASKRKILKTKCSRMIEDSIELSSINERNSQRLRQQTLRQDGHLKGTRELKNLQLLQVQWMDAHLKVRTS